MNIDTYAFDLLEGLKVLDLTRLLPGPFCSMVLADYGADVLKIEAPGAGDYLRSWEPLVAGVSAFFIAVNRNKRSLTLNLKKPEGKKLFKKLVLEHDVVLESYRPGVMERLGCGYQDLIALKPNLIYCSISGYGQAGPQAFKAGHDLNYMAETGVLNTTASREIPSLSGIQVADVAGGALYAVSAVLAAYIKVLKGGKGSFLDISMTDGLVSMLPLLSAYHYTSGMEPEPDTTIFNGQLACYNIYCTKDKREIALGALEKKFWDNFCQVIERHDLIEGNHQQLDRQDYLKSQLAQIFAGKDAAVWESLLEGRDTCCEILKTMAEVQAAPHFRARKMFYEAQVGDSTTLQQTNTAVMIDEHKPTSHNPAPKLGQHTEEVLLALGLSAAEIKELRKSEII
ncbi:MAG: CoA transferase [Deltaproteobacteria bacterium]|nr:MAG: CoA transferase [Deltaproteobacteria bacterium]